MALAAGAARAAEPWVDGLNYLYAGTAGRGQVTFTSVRELKQQIELFVQRNNADASPFQWVATAESILQKIEKIAKRISATGH